MSMPEAGTLSVVLGRCIEVGTPLGPFEGMRFSGYTAVSDTGLLHAVEECPQLRKASGVRVVDFALDASSLARLCKNWSCRWAVPDDGRWPVFLDALDAVARLRPDEEEMGEGCPGEAEVSEAACLLSRGEYPQNEGDEAAWERYEQARALRGDLLTLWRDTQNRLITAGEGLATCPWLRPWAEIRLAELAERAERQRLRLAGICIPRALADGAAISALSAPVLTPDVAFEDFGSEASEVLGRVWRAWCARARWDAKPLVDAASAALGELHAALGRRRRGREEAEESLAKLTAAWAQRAGLAAVEQSAGHPWRLIAVRIPARGRAPHGEVVCEPLTLWELAVVAVYQVAVDWFRGTAALWVPQGIGDQLLAAESSMKAVDLIEGAENWAAPAPVLLATWDPDGRSTVS
ncbi:hypothetical protein [Streptomyces sp. NPDC045369]|uniref:hypothetical protein n=1 Tax=Streptomyces sp. NPDC045369 TaxID=3155732 RepID=UPI0033F75E21